MLGCINNLIKQNLFCGRKRRRIPVKNVKKKKFKLDNFDDEEKYLFQHSIGTYEYKNELLLMKPRKSQEDIEENIFTRKLENFCCNLNDSALVKGKFMKAINLINNECTTNDTCLEEKISFRNYHLTPNINLSETLSETEELYYKYLVNFSKYKQDILNFPVIEIDGYRKYLS
jgi:hypothetical protein